MSLFGRSYRFFALACLTVCCSTAVVALEGVESADQGVTIGIRLNERSMIIVPVSVNGAGPYDFMLDTGCAKTIVDRKLARELSLPLVGEKTVIGVLDSAKVLAMHVNSVSVSGATVLGGEVLSTDRASSAAGKVRGVLGEDFLRNFDLLIDYRHRLIRLEPASGSMAQSALGEHLPLQFNASDRGTPMRNQVIVSIRMLEFGNEAMSFLLDSGTNQLTVFRDDLGPTETSVQPIWTASFSHWEASSVTARTIRGLYLGRKSLSGVTMVALPRRSDFGADGLLPTSLFQSVLICHLEGFVILDPSLPKPGRSSSDRE